MASKRKMLGLNEGGSALTRWVEKRDGHGVSIVNLRMNEPIRKPLARPSMRLLSAARVLTWLTLWVFICGFPAGAMSQQAVAPPEAQTSLPLTPQTSASTPSQPPGVLTGSITGTVADQIGHGIAGAQVKLMLLDRSLTRQATCDDNGGFAFTGLSSGRFELAITAPGFTSQTVSGTLQPGEAYTAPPIVLGLPPVVTQVTVTPPPAEVAKYQLEIEEKQRVLAVFPNFYVSYFKDSAPLSPRQKFRLAAKSILDPVNLGVTAAVAGVQQDLNTYSGFGQGTAGYAKRFGAAYADSAIGTMIGSAALPSLLKQDPRYFYKGTGSWQSRFVYAVTRAVIWKGDNGRWQPAYSSFIGNLAAGGIANLYYPAQNRSGVTLLVRNTLIGIGSDAVINVIQEFIIPKLAPPVSASQPAGN